MISCEGARCSVTGAITMTSVTDALAQSGPLFDQPHVVVDLGGITELDSSAVSLLLEWRRAAYAANRRVDFVNLPANLKSLADLYGVSELLGGQ